MLLQTVRRRHLLTEPVIKIAETFKTLKTQHSNSYNNWRKPTKISILYYQIYL